MNPSSRRGGRLLAAFEAYVHLRRLGIHICERLCDLVTSPKSFPALERTPLAFMHQPFHPKFLQAFVSLDPYS